MFDRLSVFAGAWTLDAAEAVASGGDVADWQVLDLLAALVAKSLVQAEVINGSISYRLLETVRHYAAERLALRAGSGLHDARAAHRDHYLALVEAGAATTARPGRTPPGLTGFVAEFDNSGPRWRSASPILRRRARPATGRPGCGRSPPSRGHSGEVIEALAALLGRPDARQPTHYMARALATNCQVLTHFGQSPTSSRWRPSDPALPWPGRCPVRGGHRCAVINWFSFLQGDLPAALARADEAVELARAGRSYPSAHDHPRPPRGVQGRDRRSGVHPSLTSRRFSLSRGRPETTTRTPST